MNYAEVIFENGDHSIISFETDEELQGFLTEHHQRAIDGKPGAPQDQVLRADLGPEDFDVMPPIEFMKGRPAVRIYKVLNYGDTHPSDLHPEGVDAKVVTDLVDGMKKKDGKVDHEQLIRALRDEVSPVYPVTQGKRASQFKATEDSELDLSFLPTKESEGN